MATPTPTKSINPATPHEPTELESTIELAVKRGVAACFQNNDLAPCLVGAVVGRHEYALVLMAYARTSKRMHAAVVEKVREWIKFYARLVKVRANCVRYYHGHGPTPKGVRLSTGDDVLLRRAARCVLEMEHVFNSAFGNGHWKRLQSAVQCNEQLPTRWYAHVMSERCMVCNDPMQLVSNSSPLCTFCTRPVFACTTCIVQHCTKIEIGRPMTQSMSALAGGVQIMSGTPLKLMSVLRGFNIDEQGESLELAGELAGGRIEPPVSTVLSNLSNGAWLAAAVDTTIVGVGTHAYVWIDHDSARDDLMLSHASIAGALGVSRERIAKGRLLIVREEANDLREAQRVKDAMRDSDPERLSRLAAIKAFLSSSRNPSPWRSAEDIAAARTCVARMLSVERYEQFSLEVERYELEVAIVHSIVASGAGPSEIDFLLHGPAPSISRIAMASDVGRVGAPLVARAMRELDGSTFEVESVELVGNCAAPCSTMPLAVIGGSSGGNEPYYRIEYVVTWPGLGAGGQITVVPEHLLLRLRAQCEFADPAWEPPAYFEPGSIARGIHHDPFHADHEYRVDDDDDDDDAPPPPMLASQLIDFINGIVRKAASMPEMRRHFYKFLGLCGDNMLGHKCRLYYTAQQ